MTRPTEITSGVPFGDHGFLLSLRHDDDHDEHCLCADVDDVPPDWWMRGCPTSDLPAADLWRPTREETR